MAVMNEEAARNAYESIASPKVVGACDAAFKAMSDTLKAHGFEVPNDDRAESVVTQIFMFICEANGVTFE